MGVCRFRSALVFGKFNGHGLNLGYRFPHLRSQGPLVLFIPRKHRRPFILWSGIIVSFWFPRRGWAFYRITVGAFGVAIVATAGAGRKGARSCSSDGDIPA